MTYDPATHVLTADEKAWIERHRRQIVGYLTFEGKDFAPSPPTAGRSALDGAPSARRSAPLLPEIVADSAINVEVRFRADEQARWERFFAAALQGTAADLRLGCVVIRPGVSQRVEADPEEMVGRAARIADEAVRVADERAEARRKGGA